MVCGAGRQLSAAILQLHLAPAADCHVLVHRAACCAGTHSLAGGAQALCQTDPSRAARLAPVVGGTRCRLYICVACSATVWQAALLQQSGCCNATTRRSVLLAAPQRTLAVWYTWHWQARHMHWLLWPTTSSMLHPEGPCCGPEHSTPAVPAICYGPVLWYPRAEGTCSTVALRAPCDVIACMAARLALPARFPVHITSHITGRAELCAPGCRQSCRAAGLLDTQSTS